MCVLSGKERTIMLLEEMSDEDLIFLINSGSKLAEKVFYIRYSKHSRIVAKEYLEAFPDSGITKEDFYAVIFAKTYEALTRYKTNLIEKSFYKYWRAVIKNAVYDYVRINSYQMGARALSELSFDEVAYSNNDSLMLHDMISENEADHHLMEMIKSLIEKNGKEKYFNYEENELLRLMIYEDKTIMEIMKEFNISRNHMNYLMKHIREKLEQIIKDNYL